MKMYSLHCFIILSKCKSRVEGLPTKSIRSISYFWVIFLETWMEEEKFVTDSPSIQGFIEWK